MALEQAHAEVPLPLSKYSKRVLIKSILSRSDASGGTSLIGQHVVVGGWVRSSREFRKETAAVVPAPDMAAGHKDVTCVEVLQTKLPFLRSIIRALGGEQRIREKLDAILPKPAPQPQASISILLISDGSCPSGLQVCKMHGFDQSACSRLVLLISIACPQVLVDSSLSHPNHVMPTGTCVLVEGMLQKPSLHGKETIEVKAHNILHIGMVDQERYPLSKKRIPLESLRDHTHFRPRTTTVIVILNSPCRC